MATLRLFTLFAILSSAFSFVAMAPPSRPAAISTSRPTFTAWGARGGASTSMYAGTYICEMYQFYVCL